MRSHRLYKFTLSIHSKSGKPDAHILIQHNHAKSCWFTASKIVFFLSLSLYPSCLPLSIANGQSSSLMDVLALTQLGNRQFVIFWKMEANAMQTAVFFYKCSHSCKTWGMKTSFATLKLIQSEKHGPNVLYFCPLFLDFSIFRFRVYSHVQQSLVTDRVLETIILDYIYLSGIEKSMGTQSFTCFFSLKCILQILQAVQVV